MEGDEQILEAARAIRAYLPGLAGGEAARLDRELAGLLAQAAAGPGAGDVADRILDALNTLPATQAWAASFLETGFPPDLAPLVERSAAPPGGGVPLAAPRFVCPRRDYLWFQRTVALTSPLCPTHGLALVADPRPAGTARPC